jgi:hypothetical protein
MEEHGYFRILIKLNYKNVKALITKRKKKKENKM